MSESRDIRPIEVVRKPNEIELRLQLLAAGAELLRLEAMLPERARDAWPKVLDAFSSIEQVIARPAPATRRAAA